ncbi:hypothetical protein A2U01_0117468, partial [Trifolium medium]|nr:hypothetical protein [Trifolium medium]
IEQPFGRSTPTILMASAALFPLSAGPANFLGNNTSLNLDSGPRRERKRAGFYPSTAAK